MLLFPSNISRFKFMTVFRLLAYSLVALVVSFLSPFFFIFAIISALSVYYFWGGVLLVLISLFLKHSRVVTVYLLVAVLIVGSQLLPFVQLSPNKPEGEALQILSINISDSDAGYDNLIELLQTKPADIILIQELHKDLIGRIEYANLEEYPYSYWEPSRFNLGLGFLSSLPLENAQTITHNEDGKWFPRKYIQTEVTKNGESYTLLNIHTLPPIIQNWFTSRNNEIQTYTQIVSDNPSTIIAGDFKTPPWDIARLTSDKDFELSSTSNLLQGTWNLLGVIRVPIDLTIHSSNLQTNIVTVLPNIGSDHNPVYFEIEGSKL